MKEDLRHSVESETKQLAKLEYGDAETERNARRAADRLAERGGIKQKFLGKKSLFKNTKG